MSRTRKIIIGLLTFPLLVLGLAFGTGVAHASDNANGATLYGGNYQCDGASAPGSNLTQPQGFVNYHETGDQLTLIIHLKDAAPNATYYGFLYDAYCTPDFGGAIPAITTNSNGVGNATVTVTATPGATYFYTTYAFVPGFTSAQTKAITP